MLKDIWIPKLLDILPLNISADEKLNAAARALDVELQTLSNEAWLVLHIPRLDELDHDVLDTLAWQLHCDHYEPSEMSLEVKRNLIRQSILWHRIKGTPKSVENFLGAFGIKAKTEEWFTYDGKPYFFKLKLSDVAYLGDDGDTFLRLVYAAKNERSWLEDFIFDLTQEPPDTELHVGFPAAVVDYATIETATPDVATDIIFVGNVYQDTSKMLIDSTFGDLENLEFYPAINFLLDFSGYEEIDAVFGGDDEFDGKFEKLLWERWLKWKDDPLVKHYTHHFDDDEGEIDPDDPEPYEPFPLGREFLRLYWDYPDNVIRYTTLYNPRENLVGSEINFVGDYAASHKVLQNSKGKNTLGIRRALLITRSIQNLLGGHPPKNDNGKFHNPKEKN